MREELTFATSQREASKHDHGNPFCHKGRILPSLFLIGAQKSGTSTLWTDLTSDFKVKPANHVDGTDPAYVNKEVHFFDRSDRYDRGSDFYLKHWPQCKNEGPDTRALD